MAANKSWCLIFAVVFLQVSVTWVFAEDNEFGFSLIQNSFDSGAGASNDSLGGTSNETGTAPVIGGGDQQFSFPWLQGGDQPQQDQGAAAATPTRPPADPNRVSTFPPLVHEGPGNATGQAANTTTAKPAAPTELPKPKNEKGGSAEFYGSLALVLTGACALNLLY